MSRTSVSVFFFQRWITTFKYTAFLLTFVLCLFITGTLLFGCLIPAVPGYTNISDPDSLNPDPDLDLAESESNADPDPNHYLLFACIHFQSYATAISVQETVAGIIFDVMWCVIRHAPICNFMQVREQSGGQVLVCQTMPALSRDPLRQTGRLSLLARQGMFMPVFLFQ